MSLEDIRRECSDAAKLLQPYVDGELTGEDQERVADHLGGCDACRAAVREQQWVRTSLQSIERERAPEALRAHILLALDGVDRKREEAARNEIMPGFARRAAARVRDLFRGGMVMIPAGAVAVALFVAARQGWLPGDAVTGDAAVPADGRLVAPTPTSEGDDQEALDALAKLRPQVDFPVQVASSRTEAQLVGAGLDQQQGEQRPSAWVRYRVRRPDGNHARIIDRQLPAARLRTGGQQRLSSGGLTYYLDRDARGVPVVSFRVGDVAHVLAVEPGGSGQGAASGAVSAEQLLVRLADHLNRTAAQQ